MPEFDIDSALSEPDPFSVAPVDFREKTLYYLVYTPSDGSAPFYGAWYTSEAEAKRMRDRANRHNKVVPYPFKRTHGGSVLRVPHLPTWLKTPPEHA